MKITKKALFLALCGVLCVTVFSCVSGGQSTDGFGPGIPVTGVWSAFVDDNNGGSSRVTMTEVEMEGMKAYRFVGNTTTQYQYGFVGWVITPDEETLANLKKARALSFKFVSDGKRQSFKYRISSVRDYADHEYHFAGEAGVVERLEVPIRFFQQPSWGTPVRLNQDNVVDIAWQTHESWRPGNFEITIWDVRVHP